MDENDNLKNISKVLTGFLNIATVKTIEANIPETTPIAPYISTTFQAIGNEIIERIFSKREKEKISITYLTACQKIYERVENGDIPRDEVFFTRPEGDYSSADKLLEAVFIESRNEYDNKKLVYLGNLTANLLFTNEHDFDRCMYFIKIAENLNYRQLCYISLLNNKSKYKLDRKVDLNKTPYMIMPIDHRSELNDMVVKCIIKGPKEFKPDLALPLEWYNTDWVGEQLYKLMNLEMIPEIDVKKLAVIQN